MLTYEQRVERYLAQTGRTWRSARESLTPRQRRRANHKRLHQWDVAVERRAERSAARQEARRKRAQERRTSAVLPKTSR